MKSPIDLTERQAIAHKLRQQGMIYKNIGKKMGITASRARSLYIEAERRLNYVHVAHWSDGLSVRLLNTLSLRALDSREKILEDFQSGSLRPGKSRNYGQKSHVELAKWLGLPDPMIAKQGEQNDVD